MIANRQPSTPVAEAAAVTAGSATSFRFGLMWENRRLRKELENAAGEAELLRALAERSNRIIGFSSRYNIPADLAETIFDIALQEGVDPDLAFRVVELESGFNPRAVSRVGAIGLAQVMPATAREMDNAVNRERLFDPKTNLTLGFRYLRHLIVTYPDDLRLALLAYNLGEPAVEQALRAGRNPLEGYNRILLPAYQGTGLSN